MLGEEVAALAAALKVEEEEEDEGEGATKMASILAGACGAI